MTSMITAKRRRARSSPLATTGTAAAAAVLLLGAGRLHHALAFSSAGTFTTAAAACDMGGSGAPRRCIPMSAPSPTALQAEAGTGTGPWSSSSPTSHNSHNNAGQSQRHKTAMEGAILVEWEPISELERRIEDGVHYEHFPDFEHVYGSEEAQRLRKRAARARTARRAERRRSGGGGGGGGGGWTGGAGDQVRSADSSANTMGDGVADDDDANLEAAQGVFVGFRVTEEEVGRLRSADPDDFSG